MATSAKAARHKERYKNDPVFRDAHKKRVSDWIKANPTKSHQYLMKSRYGITPAEYQQMIVSQDGKCAICGNHFIRTPQIDHDHITGKVRALLCYKCNSLLGYAYDDVDILQNAIDYLVHFSKG